MPGQERIETDCEDTENKGRKEIGTESNGAWARVRERQTKRKRERETETEGDTGTTEGRKNDKRQRQNPTVPELCGFSVRMHELPSLIGINKFWQLAAPRILAAVDRSQYENWNSVLL